MDELKLDRLELPKGGWVEFNDPEMVTGKDIDRIRESWHGARVAGEALNKTMALGAELLIRDWRPSGTTDDMPMPPVKAFWPKLNWRDKRAIEKHIEPVMNELLGFKSNIAGASPQTPASE